MCIKLKTEHERTIRFIAKIMLVLGLAMLIPLVILSLTALPLFWEKEGIDTGARIFLSVFLLAGFLAVLMSIYRLCKVVDYVVINTDEKVIAHFRKKKIVNALKFSDIDHLLINRHIQRSNNSIATTTSYHIRVPELKRISIFESTSLKNVIAKAEELADLMGLKIINEANDSTS
jgi:hypothetical protein